MRLFEWKSFCILYEDNDGLVRLQELLKTPSPHEFKVTIRQLPHGNDYRWAQVAREVVERSCAGKVETGGTGVWKAVIDD